MAEWITTTVDNLPWGETVEVRWPDGGVKRLQPYKDRAYLYWWEERDYPEKDIKLHIRGTEWRRLAEKEAQG